MDMTDTTTFSHGPSCPTHYNAKAECMCLPTDEDPDFDGYFTKRGGEAMQFLHKRSAIEAAKAIGWGSGTVQRMTVMGFELWGLGDDHGNWLRVQGYALLKQDRERR